MDKKTSTAIVVLLVVVVGFISFSHFSGKQNPTAQKIHATGQSEKEKQVTVAVKEIISKYLVAPATAQYANFTVRIIDREKNEYFAFGDIDSQNTYGALLRNHFSMYLIHNSGAFDDAGNYSVDTFNFGDDVIILNGKIPEYKMTLTELNSVYPEAVLMMKQLEDSLTSSPDKLRF